MGVHFLHALLRALSYASVKRSISTPATFTVAAEGEWG